MEALATHFFRPPVGAAAAAGVASGLRRRRRARRCGVACWAKDEEEDEEADLEAKFAELDEELDELKEKLTQELDARGAALTERVDELLARMPATAVRIEEEAAVVGGATRPRGSTGRLALPELQRVAVCGVGAVGGEGAGQRLHALLVEASASEADAPRWVDLEEAADMDFEALDARLLRAQAAVVCPDLQDDRRRSIAGVRAGLKAVIASLPQTLSRVVLLSNIGAQSMKGGINMRSFFGLGYGSTITGLEDELTSAARRRGRTRPLDVTIMRVGPFRPLDTPAKVRCLPGDAQSGGPTTVETAAEALLQALALSVDVNVCVVDEPDPAQASQPPDWPELLLPFIGPEVWRAEVSSAARAAVFAQSWAAEWFGTADEKGSMKDTLRWGLKTPVQLRNTPTGVIFKFRPLGTPIGRDFKDLEEGGFEFIAEVPASGRPRLRVKRCSYGSKVIIKENSERAVLRKFREDWAEAGL